MFYVNIKDNNLPLTKKSPVLTIINEEVAITNHQQSNAHNFSDN